LVKGYNNLVSLNAALVTPHEDLRGNVKSVDRNCYFSDEYKLDLHKNYTQVRGAWRGWVNVISTKDGSQSDVSHNNISRNDACQNEIIQNDAIQNDIGQNDQLATLVRKTRVKMNQSDHLATLVRITLVKMTSGNNSQNGVNQNVHLATLVRMTLVKMTIWRR